MLLIVIGAGECGSLTPCAAPLFLLHMEHSHSSCSSVVFSGLLAFRIGRRSMALSLCTNPVVFLGGTAGCAFISSLTHRLLCWAQLSKLSVFGCPFDSNGRLSVCPFESNGRLCSSCSGSFAVRSLGSKDVFLWPQSACSISSFLTAAVFRS